MGVCQGRGLLIPLSPPFTALGGLGFSLKEIGISLTIAGVLMLPMALFAFPLVSLPV